MERLHEGKTIEQNPVERISKGYISYEVMPGEKARVLVKTQNPHASSDILLRAAATYEIQGNEMLASAPGLGQAYLEHAQIIFDVALQKAEARDRLPSSKLTHLNGKVEENGVLQGYESL